MPLYRTLDKTSCMMRGGVQSVPHLVSSTMHHQQRHIDLLDQQVVREDVRPGGPPFEVGVEHPHARQQRGVQHHSCDARPLRPQPHLPMTHRQQQCIERKPPPSNYPNRPYTQADAYMMNSQLPAVSPAANLPYSLCRLCWLIWYDSASGTACAYCHSHWTAHKAQPWTHCPCCTEPPAASSPLLQKQHLLSHSLAQSRTVSHSLSSPQGPHSHDKNRRQQLALTVGPDPTDCPYSTTVCRFTPWSASRDCSTALMSQQVAAMLGWPLHTP
jgi:hypothetical protein